MSAAVSKSLTTIERKSASLTQDAVMAFDFEDRRDRVGGFGLAVVFVQIKAERAVADTARVLGLEVVDEMGLHPRPFVDDKAVMRVQVDPLGAHRLGEFDLAAADPVG